jgi:hypothetical protein
METLRWKARIAVLWISAAVAMSAHMILLTLDPAPMKKVVEWAATAGQGEWIFMALFWLIPLWLAFAAMTVKGASGRWLHFVVAIVFTLLNVWHFFICGVPLTRESPFTKPAVHHMLLVGSTAVATVLIAWYAWKWPEQEA